MVNDPCITKVSTTYHDIPGYNMVVTQVSGMHIKVQQVSTLSPVGEVVERSARRSACQVLGERSKIG